MPGDNVRLRLRGIEEEDVRVGFVLCHPNSLARPVRVFDVKMSILEHKSIICSGYSAVMHIHSAVEEVRGDVSLFIFTLFYSVCFSSPSIVCWQ